jgi:hypothetical protein
MKLKIANEILPAVQAFPSIALAILDYMSVRRCQLAERQGKVTTHFSLLSNGQGNQDLRYGRFRVLSKR